MLNGSYENNNFKTKGLLQRMERKKVWRNNWCTKLCYRSLATKNVCKAKYSAVCKTNEVPMCHISFTKANIWMGINYFCPEHEIDKNTNHTECRDNGIISVWEALSWRGQVWGPVLLSWEWVSLLPWDVPFSNNSAVWTVWRFSGSSNINLMPLLFVNITLGESLRAGCLPSRRRARRLIAEATGGLPACRTA